MADAMAQRVKSADGLRRELGLFAAVSMIVGIVIGSGIFLGVNRVPAGAGSALLMTAVWIVAGLLTLMGALCYAELGVIFPRAGGEYVFLKEGMGSLAAFLSGWTAFTINLAGSAAALAVIFAEQLNALKPDGFGALVFVDAHLGGYHLVIDGVKLTAAALIGVLSVVNHFGVRTGGNVQMTLTVLKGGLIALLAVAALAYFGDAPSPRIGFAEQAQVAGTPSADGFSLPGILGLSMVAALFAYDGWTNVVRVGSELKEPGRNIPKAMLFGLLAIMGLYVLVSFGYVQVLGFEGFADGTQAGFENARTVASNAASVLFGAAGQAIIAVMILVSVLGALNGIILSGPRIYYAMSRDRIFPSTFTRLSRHDTPSRAIAAQAALGIAFLFFFDFNQLTDNVVFISFFFYGLAAAGLIVLRRTHPELPRPYRVPLYPWLPLAYIAVALTFVGYLLYEQVTTLSFENLNRLAGLVVVFAGLPVFFWYRGRLVREARAAGLPPPPPLWGPDPNAGQEAPPER